ncbi:hypothetical protein KP509_13G065300 [Ceratopteris richardii]|uniref:Uncharacterized protein n=1 Tax=Ceratopteris richardii TaxID=49495 RepID=A0A8T2TIM0_CERRI|nr:hypothetical protein KP509_13G065300 [Ceratopteris richardii]KAH7421597.1 hypothetical protein KP509_13G065300 [Ceratopteris richardii]
MDAVDRLSSLPSPCPPQPLAVQEDAADRAREKLMAISQDTPDSLSLVNRVEKGQDSDDSVPNQVDDDDGNEEFRKKLISISYDVGCIQPASETTISDESLVASPTSNGKDSPPA